MLGPRATSAFLVLTALLFAVLLGLLSWRTAAGGASWPLLAGVVVAVGALGAAIVFARSGVKGSL